MTKANTVETTVPVWTAGVPVDSTMTRIFLSNAKTYSTKKKTVAVSHGELKIRLDSRSGVVLSSRPQAVL